MRRKAVLEITRDHMGEPYPRERLSVLEELLKKRLDVENGRPWTLDPKALRFKHGESLAELKVPYHLGAEDEACIENAVGELAALMVKRYEPAGVDGRKDTPQVILTTPSLKEKSFRTDLFITDSLEKKIAIEALASVPYIDSGILSVWLGAGGQGRKLIKWTGELIEKTLRDEARNLEEKTSYLALLALLNTIRKKKEKIKGLRIRGLSYEKIDLTVGLTLFIAIKEALAQTLGRLRDQNASCYNAATDIILSSAVTPKAFLLIPSSILSTSLNPYGLTAELHDLLSEHCRDFMGEPEAMVAGLYESVSSKGDVMEALRQQEDVIRFREEALNYLSEFDIPGDETSTILYDAYSEDRLIKNLLGDQKLSATLLKTLDGVREKYARDPRRTEVVSGFQKFLSSFKKSVFGGFFGGRREEDLSMRLLEGYVSYLFDDHVEKFAGSMRAAIADRRGELNQNMLMEEYNRGRLYRFSTDDRPILKMLEVNEEGQLFIDMKDFTRKTLKVKEIAMADFMKVHFYKPILTAAARYGVGTGIVEDERGIRLTNLPGDAAIFSGGVTNLVSLARDIQTVIRRYREQILKRLPPRKEEELLDEVHRRFEERKAGLKQKRAELNAALERNEPAVESKLVSLGEEEHRLENTYREELENAIKGELEAGLYISYGAKAESMVVETREEFCGSVKVAIGEKINEASRGTFRNALVRAKLEVLLENERTKRRNKNVKYPFDIYIDRVFSIKIPPELDSAFEKLLSKRNISAAQAMSQIMANEFLTDLKKIIDGEPFTNLRLVTSTTDIYNKGEALSAAALEAYMRENKGQKWFFKKTVKAEDLDPSIQEAFFFPSSPLEFWFGHYSVKGTEYAEGFYRSGEVIFKGFEVSTPTVVYEMMNPEGDFFKALLKHHFHRWADEAKKADAEESFLGNKTAQSL